MQTTDDRDVLRAGELEIFPAEGLVRVNDYPLALSVRELSLLVALARRTGRITTRDELFAAVWGGELRPTDRSVDVYIHKLRIKLTHALPGWEFIHTHHGFGYRFQPQPPAYAASRHFHNRATTP